MAAPTALARRVYRHRLPVRVMHWINAICFLGLLGSGLNIFNAHPALYWGHDSARTPWLEINAETGADGRPVGTTRIGGARFETTGVLGVSSQAGEPSQRAFPAWATVPSSQWLAMARRWHFFFAWVLVVNGLCYVAWTVVSGHLRRDLVPTRAEWRGIRASLRDHLLLRHPSGDAARRYNVLQNAAYLAVVFGLLPLVVICGWAMSPRLDSVFAGWVDWLGGRQSARSLHFLAAVGLTGFLAIHLFEVVVAGAWNEIRSMVTGWYRLPEEKR